MHRPTKRSANEDGLEITFTTPLDHQPAPDPDSHSVEQWSYIRSEDYGSTRISVRRRRPPTGLRRRAC